MHAPSSPATTPEAFAPLNVEIVDGVAQGTVHINAKHCVGPVGRQFIFGGMAMALGIRLFEAGTGKHVIWSAMQFLAPTMLGEELHLTLAPPHGKSILQARLTGTVRNRPVVQALASLRSLRDVPDHAADIDGQWTHPGQGPGPEDCARVMPHADADHDSHSHVEIRLPEGRFGMFSRAQVTADRRITAWMRPRSGVVDAAALGYMADFVPSITNNVLGRRSGGSSLDNTIRIVRIVPTEWVRCEICVDTIADGLAHGRMAQFAQDGTLMAMGNQTYVVRLLPDRTQAGG